MPRAFAEIAYTPAVRAAQQRHGSGPMNDRFLAPEAGPANLLGPEETAFVAARDGFYQATVSATGWPYVQFRGGPPGFLKVLDQRTIAYADFRGNRQYISTGNLSENDRISVILMDYPNRRRIKIWGRARVADDPELMARLTDADYDGVPEQAVVFEISAWDVNCPQHITPRFSETQVAEITAPLKQRIAELEAELETLRP